MSYVIRAYCGLNGAHGDDGKSTQREALIVTLCEKHFPAGVTTYDAVGLWAGCGQERTVVVELITDNLAADYNKLRLFAANYKDSAAQECVMLTKQLIDADFI
jgi:hypothetical protein